MPDILPPNGGLPYMWRCPKCKSDVLLVPGESVKCFICGHSEPTPDEEPAKCAECGRLLPEVPTHQTTPTGLCENCAEELNGDSD